MRFSLLPSRCLRSVVAGGLLLVASGLPAAQATDQQWRKEHFRYVANDRSVRTVLKKFAATQRLHISIAEQVKGRVSADFDLPSQRFLDTLAEQFHFSWRVTGNTLRILPRISLPTPDALGPRPGLDSTLALRNSANGVDPYTPATPMAIAATDPALTPLQVWTTTPGDRTLQNALARWCSAAGWQLFWELPQDFSIEATASINGSFEDAITVVTNSLQMSETPVTALFYDGNRVLRIVAAGSH